MIPIVVHSLRRRWVEYGLVAVAIGIVVAAVLVQRSTSASAQKAVHELAHQLGSNMLVVPEKTDMAAFWNNEYGGEVLPSNPADRLRDSPVAQHLRTLESRLQAKVQVNGKEVVLVGTDVGPFGAEPGDVVPAVLTRWAARQLGAEQGFVLNVQGVPVSIAAVIDGVSGHPGDGVYVPIAGAQRILRKPGAVNALQLSGCWCSIDVATLGRDVERTLPGTRSLTVAGMLAAQKGSVAVAERYAALLQTGCAVAVALLVLGVVASQARRRNCELALFSAIGANPVWVAALFTVEAAVAGGAGAVLGHVFVHVGGGWLGTRLVGAPWVVDWALLGPIVAITSAIAAIAGAIPAMRAASADVTTILREA